MITHDQLRRYYCASLRLPVAFVKNAESKLGLRDGKPTTELDWRMAARIARTISKFYASYAIETRQGKKTRKGPLPNGTKRAT